MSIEEDIKNNAIRVKEFDIKKGGIYLETTDDPRGWMLGDKTRKIYQVTIAQVALLTNLLIAVSHHWNGIKVKVHNPDEVGRMLVSLNDDVGSSGQLPPPAVGFSRLASRLTGTEGGGLHLRM